MDTENVSKAGYEYLLAYKLTVPIYDYTVQFVKKYVKWNSRTIDQMEQAARSGMQNIIEGSKQQSLATYIKLVGVARGSLEELLKDYESYARQNSIPIWNKDKSKREIGEIREIWELMTRNKVLPKTPYFPPLPTHPYKAVNLLFSLIKQASYLQDKLISSLREKHLTEGGFSEKLLASRLKFRKAHH